MKATNSQGILQQISNCYIILPTIGKVMLNNLPELSDSKSAHYNAESIIGRSSPVHTFHFSDTRIISIQFHLYVIEPDDIQRNITFKRAVESCLYPQGSTFGITSLSVANTNSGATTFASYSPPPICRISFGSFLADGEVCVALQSCSVKAPSDVAYDPDTLCPFKFDLDTTWWVVYSSDMLPDQSQILTSGR